jgi:ubiquinone/menaquinone biosynthesis C-methylase UbiE
VLDHGHEASRWSRRYTGHDPLAARLHAMDSDEYKRMAAVGDKHWWYRSTRILLRQLVEPHMPTSSHPLNLDAAGGTGATGGWLTSHAPTIEADFEQFALEFARDHVGYLPVRADLNHLPFTDQAFTTVLCVTALCHRMNPDPGAIVRDFARVSRPGGVVALMEPGGKRLWRSHDDVTHTGRRFSVDDLRTMATDAGLEVITATGAYTFLVPPAYVLGKLERGKAKSDVGRNESGMGGLLGLLARAERRLLRRWSLPFGLSVIVIARKPG